MNMKTAKREWNSEVSIIDTGIFICGAILAGEYFRGEVKEKASYDGIKDIVYTYYGTLFTYQYSHAWIDFRGLKDKEGIDWFENSIKATLANRKYCINNSKKYKTFGENSWGLTACVGPRGYSGDYGAMPALNKLERNDGTISPSGAAGSIVFTPEYSIKALEYYYNNFPKLWCKYGFKDSYNLENSKEWYSKECIGIDKGISMIMIENYFTDLIWRYFMKNECIVKGLNILNITKKDKELELAYAFSSSLFCT